jgi:peptidoglycan/LPS O-acetylase OafA/YrhL
MLSGLVSGYTLAAKPVELGMKSVGKYMWKKLCKLYPLYFCTVLFTVLSTNLPESLFAAGIAASGEPLKLLIRALLLVQAWFPEGYYAYNGVGWFLSSMMFLYALTLPVMAVLGKVDKHPRRYFLFVFLSGSVLFATAVYCYVTQKLDMEYWHYIFPPARMGEYLVGMIMGIMFCSIKPKIKAGVVLRVVFTVLEMVVLLYWFRSLSSPGNYWRNHIISWLIPNIALLGVFVIGGGWVSKLFCWKPLVRLGDASFASYLIHQIIINLYGAMHPESCQSQQGQMAAFVFCLMVSVLFALCLNRKQKA